jgi:hypothetical protein
MLPPKSIEADNVTAITFFEVFFILFPPLLLYCFTAFLLCFSLSDVDIPSTFSRVILFYIISL